jgi:hypothetical protein
VFYERVKVQLKEKTNWTDSDELKLMFSNTYPPAFYKQLHRYVHRSYGWHLALRQIGRLIVKPARLTKQNFRQAASILYQLPAAIIARQKLKRLEHGN